MRYCDYTFYKNTYMGTMPESLFNRLSIIASAKIKAAISNRVSESDPPEEVKLCTCNIADVLREMEKSDGKKSESVGSWSISYEDNAVREEKLYKIMKDYLSSSVDSEGTPLLYRGC